MSNFINTTQMTGLRVYYNHASSLTTHKLIRSPASRVIENFESQLYESYFTTFINVPMHGALFCTGMTFKNRDSFDLTRGNSTFGVYTNKFPVSFGRKGSLWAFPLHVRCFSSAAHRPYPLALLYIDACASGYRIHIYDQDPYRGYPENLCLLSLLLLYFEEFTPFPCFTMPPKVNWKALTFNRRGNRGSDPTVPGIPSSRRKKKHIIVDSLKMSLQFLFESSDACPPLKSAIGAMQHILSVVEVR